MASSSSKEYEQVEYIKMPPSFSEGSTSAGSFAGVGCRVLHYFRSIHLQRPYLF